MTSAVAELASPFTNWQTWFVMARQDISLRYKRSVIGPFWISISQACTVLAIAYFYSQIFARSDFQSYLIHLALGLAAWNFLSTMINEACQIVLEAEGHLKSVPIPVPVLAARMVCRNLIVFAHVIVVFAIIIYCYGARLQPIALLAIPAIMIYALLGFFIAITLGPLCARFRDIPQIVQSALQVAFFLSPIMWSAEQLPEGDLRVHANPFYHVLEIFRAPINGRVPSSESMVVVVLILAGLIITAVASFALTRRRVYLWL